MGLERKVFLLWLTQWETEAGNPVFLSESDSSPQRSLDSKKSPGAGTSSPRGHLGIEVGGTGNVWVSRGQEVFS